MLRATGMPSGLQAVFASLLHADVRNPGFEITESGEEIIITAPAGGDIFSRLQEIFRSHGHTMRHIPFQLAPVSASSASVPGGEGSQQFPMVTFPLVNIQGLDGNVIFARLFNEDVRRSTGNIHWQPAPAQHNQIIYYHVCESESEAQLRTS
jgi:hypothetical protein